MTSERVDRALFLTAREKNAGVLSRGKHTISEFPELRTIAVARVETEWFLLGRNLSGRLHRADPSAF